MDYNKLFAMIITLPADKLVQLIDDVKALITNDFTDLLKPTQCPECSSKNFKKNGHDRVGGQRYMCKTCGKTFTETTGTIFEHTKLPMETWIQFINIMFNPDMFYSLDKIVEELGVCKRTAHYMRHRVCDAIGESYSDEELSGTIQADELYMRVSYKGHKGLPTSGKKRGGKPLQGKQVSPDSDGRGLGSDKVCVLTAMDNNGDMFLRKVKLGKIDKETIEDNLASRTVEGSILCTDGDKSYIGFAKNNDLEHVRIVASKGFGNNGYHINSINNLHSRFRRWIQRFNGVSTKYLQGYLNWFSLCIRAEEQRNAIKIIVEKAPKIHNRLESFNQPRTI